jgi:hypothetical protein
MVCLKDKFRQYTRNSELPIDQDHLVNLTILDDAMDKTDKFQFNAADYETDEEHR